MTFREKIDILSMDFSCMWYRLWLYNPEKNCNILSLYNKPSNSQKQKNLKCYYRKKNKFESSFLNDGGKELIQLINNSTNTVTPWEIPKGGRYNNELEMNSARREFEEESNISASDYTILYDVNPLKFSHTDDNIVYNAVYYIAYINNTSQWKPSIKFNTCDQLMEIEEIKWVSIEEIEFLDLNKEHKDRLLYRYKSLIKPFKNTIKNKYYKYA